MNTQYPFLIIKAWSMIFIITLFPLPYHDTLKKKQKAWKDLHSEIDSDIIRK